MRTRIAFSVFMLLWVLAACNLAGEPPTQPPSQITPPSNSRPQITIVSVTPGQNVAVNTQVIVTAQILDDVGVTRVQMTANGRVVKTVSSTTATGDTNRSVQLDFTPSSIGVITLQVVASRLDGTQSDPAGVQITVGSVPTNTPLPGGGSTGGGQPAPNPCLNISATTCTACVSNAAGANLRPAPSTQTTPIRVLPSGSLLPIVGRTSDNQWWQVRDGTSNVWLSDVVIDTLGVCTNIPIVANSGLPTATAIIIPSSTPVIATATFTVAPPTATRALPDLVVPQITGELAPSLGGGSSVSVTYTIVITNTGLGASGSFTSNLVVQPGNRTIDLGVISSLGPGESITLPTTLSFTAAGSYTLTARADSGSTVTESFEANNTNTIVVTVSS
ncbi:MAG: SH3 domain-containing protein [Chloroflexi bacterium]|nr:SH3 domain-containing protein [Chloroflexota bacterium]